jgi:hypothetical protein
MSYSENSSLKRFQDEITLKWNLQRKKDGSFVSEIWFDNLGTWSRYNLEEGEIFGWDGLIFLEPPIKTPNSAYPYSVKAKCLHYSSEGELLETHEEIICGIWDDNSEKINFVS